MLLGDATLHAIDSKKESLLKCQRIVLQALQQMGFPIPESYGKQRKCHTMGLHRNGIPRWRKLLLYTPGIHFGTSDWWLI